ncbi:MAG: DUF2202 domain-containing protein [Bacteroidia bacterium]|nr:DUF2202 domain-containing protein [Bacteroidia bacterium]
MKTNRFRQMAAALLISTVLLPMGACSQDPGMMPASQPGMNAGRPGRGPGQGLRAGPPADCAVLDASYAKGSLSAAEAEAIRYMREEEKLARDVYLALDAKWNHQTFSHIAQAEQRHMDWTACLLNRYSLEDPIAGLPAGTFRSPAMQALYDSLTAAGSENLGQALHAGAFIEDLDLADLDARLELADNADVQAVFQTLASGSRNHLRAFSRSLGRIGLAYAPVYLSADAYAEILASPQESGELCGASCSQYRRGTGGCAGNCPQQPGSGRGRGAGRGPRS